MSKNFDPEALSEFARHYGFHYKAIDPPALVEEVKAEMERGLRGEPSSLPMIPAYITPASTIKPSKTVIALDAGGTNLRAALVMWDENGAACIQSVRKAPMPGTKGQLGKNAFFDEIAALIIPLMEASSAKIEGIGFCFSYPIEITKDADGMLLAFSKEVDAPEVIGTFIGAGLKEALRRQGAFVPEKVIVLNDTAAALLSGLSAMPAQGDFHQSEHRFHGESSASIGFILGTGFNTAYPETTIPKINFTSSDKPQIVVCESGNFAHRYTGSLDKEFDSGTKTPGSYTLEKTAAGAYLGPLTFHIAKRALHDGLFSFKRRDEFCALPTLSTKDLNDFLQKPFNGNASSLAKLFTKDEHSAVASLLYTAALVTERGALLSAAVLAAVVEKSCPSVSPFAPARIAVEGSTYLLYKGMRPALDSYLHMILNRDKPRPYSIVPVETASLLGAATAAVM